jgi:pimeloyl-ACP methyl ester carboxylesterase
MLPPPASPTNPHIPTAELAGFSADRWVSETERRLSAVSTVVATARGEVELAVLGDGAATVLVLHGTPGGFDQGHWLARNYGPPGSRYLIVSRPGYLRTPLSAGAEPAAQADLYAELLSLFGIERVAVWGLSGGGPSALELAKRHPSRVWALVMSSAVTQAFPDLPAEAPAIPDSLGFLAVILPSVGLLGFEPHASAVQRIQADPRMLAEAHEFLQTGVPASLRQAGQANDMQHFRTLDVLPGAAFGVPTLILHGRSDGNVPVAHAQALADAIQGVGGEVELVLFDDAGHTVSITDKPRYSEELARFLAVHQPM